jgi:hypothetical protein
LSGALAVIGAIAGVAIYVNQVWFETCFGYLYINCPAIWFASPLTFVALLALFLVAGVVFGALMTKGYGLRRVPPTRTPTPPSD